MGPRSALIVSALLLLPGCSSLGDAAGGPGDDAGAGDNDMGMPAADAGVNCGSLITISFASTPGATPVLERITATAIVVGRYQIPRWQILLGSQTIAPTSGQGTLTITLDATQTGEYLFLFDNGFGCTTSATYKLVAPNGIPVDYVFRVLPPESSGAPLKDIVQSFVGATPPAQRQLVLDPGMPITSVLLGPGSRGAAGEIRFVAEAGPDAVATAQRSAPVGMFTVLVAGTIHYRPLLIPFDSTLAPLLMPSATGTQLAALVASSASSPFVVDAGATVAGSVVDAAGQPLAANVVLHAGPLPSSVGAAGTDGKFMLQAQAAAGPFGVEVGAAGWPTVTLDGVVVPAAGTQLQVAYRATRLPITGTVASSAGTPLVGARVTVQSTAGQDLAGVATIAVGGGAPTPVAGRVSQVAVTGALGALPALALPAGSYDILIDPAGATGAAATDGITFAQVTVSAAASWSLKLQPKVGLSGVVVDTAMHPVAGARVVAVESGGLGAAFVATTSSDPKRLGAFSFQVDPGLEVDLTVEPPSTSATLANATLRLARGAASATVALGHGFAVPARVLLNAAPLAGAVVQVLSPSGGSPLTSQVSDSSGMVTVYIPDPGERSPDGGTD